MKHLRCPAFVTWYKRVPRRLTDSEDGEELRGSVGTFSAIIPEEIRDYALIAAQEDSRLPPIELGEVPTLKGTVTVIHSFEVNRPHLFCVLMSCERIVVKCMTSRIDALCPSENAVVLSVTRLRPPSCSVRASSVEFYKAENSKRKCQCGEQEGEREQRIAERQQTKNSRYWKTGVHGLAAKFHVNGQIYSGAYLPQVMVEFEMKANDIAELIRKAQYFGEITEELLDSVQLTKFQGTHGSLSFSEHKNEHGVMTGVTCSNGHVNGKQSRKFSGGTERHR
ncbi:AMMECR1 family protein [Toxoplasma gondii RUB]|uniref:AMMECR1 family protein n=7 Tax=Toxoplasma gondii TaxID=5811 RepID=V4ZBA6_TOXGV|nr:AMMECR1 family protein [Toxoplasma gondii VEG]KFG42895.1 AMMECR1 family protein [Toxoplasma gondii p89]KFG55104.1 AMMECR1 family protein [Toxoplasma gondii FOU]KFG60791.1 AMMECR1 family protein [Toxoplasma gondii RUB]KFH13289.1 AMMECR1 family protein [Toxoplasma gondii VAND]PUA91237.1 AMMECR1 family protein [Toxoplasma gondii TgCATBr9]RQX74595.1 AMMECR1 family protein [Toxoplasma gondii CAST]